MATPQGGTRVFSASIVTGVAAAPRTVRLAQSSSFFCSATGFLGINAGMRWGGYGAEIASALMAGAVGALLWAPCLGLLMDRFGPARVLAIGMGAIAALMLLFYLSPNIVFASLAAAAMTGSLSGAYAVSTMALYSQRLGAALGVSLGIGRVGGLIGAPAMALLISSFSWGGACIIVGLVAGIASICAALLGKHLTKPADL